MSKDYIASEYRRMHQRGTFSGASLEKHLSEIRQLIKQHDIHTLLDYGCGKAKCHEKKLVEQTTLYDPYCEPYSNKPEGTFDMVICTDVMEHVPEEDVGKVLAELLNYTDKVLYLSIATYPASKKFSNGENVHLTIKPKEWWESMLSNGKGIKIVSNYT